MVGEESREGEGDVPCRLTQLEKPLPFSVFCKESGVPPQTALNLNTPYFPETPPASTLHPPATSNTLEICPSSILSQGHPAVQCALYILKQQNPKVCCHWAVVQWYSTWQRMGHVPTLFALNYLSLVRDCFSSRMQRRRMQVFSQIYTA